MNINQMSIVYISKDGNNEKILWKDIILVVPLDFIPSEFEHFIRVPKKERKDDFILLDFYSFININSKESIPNFFYTKKKLSPLFVKNLLIQGDQRTVRVFRYNKEKSLHEIRDSIFGDYTPQEFIRGDMKSVLKFLKESISNV